MALVHENYGYIERLLTLETRLTTCCKYALKNENKRCLMTSQKEKNVLTYRDRDLDKKYSVKDADQDWLQQQWKARLKDWEGKKDDDKTGI